MKRIWDTLWGYIPPKDEFVAAQKVGAATTLVAALGTVIGWEWIKFGGNVVTTSKAVAMLIIILAAAEEVLCIHRYIKREKKGVKP